MDSSTLLQSQTQAVFTSSDIQRTSEQPLEFESWIGDYTSGENAEECENSKVVDFQPIPSHNPNQLYLPLPFPNFLINPYDGEFTPYLDRSPMPSPTEESEHPSSVCPSLNLSPRISTKTLQSRSTTLRKILETQEQMFSDISAIWRRKFPVESSLTSPSPAEPATHRSDEKSVSNHQSAGI